MLLFNKNYYIIFNTDILKPQYTLSVYSWYYPYNILNIKIIFLFFKNLYIGTSLMVCG